MRARLQADGGLKDIPVRVVERVAAFIGKGLSISPVEADVPLPQWPCLIFFAAHGLHRVVRLR